jgi:hemerythrin-like domain-containing protein
MALRGAQILRFDVVTCRETTLNAAHFDRREMLIIHDVLRREFALMPGLIAAVAVGDRERAALVAEHIDGLTTLLHHHHSGEDANVWPLLLARSSGSAAALTESMHDQHEQLATLLDAVDAELAVWRIDAATTAGKRLVDALDQLLPLLWRHLEDEERDVVPLLEQHVTAAEWDDMVQKGSADADPASLPLGFGMMMYEGDPEIVERALAAMPGNVRPVVAELAAQAFAEHSLAVHGTSTPPRSTELAGSQRD